MGSARWLLVAALVLLAGGVAAAVAVEEPGMSYDDARVCGERLASEVVGSSRVASVTEATVAVGAAKATRSVWNLEIGNPTRLVRVSVDQGSGRVVAVEAVTGTLHVPQRSALFEQRC